MTHEAGKGDTQRPTDHEKFSSNYDTIFRKTKEDWKPQDTTKEKANDREQQPN